MEEAYRTLGSQKSRATSVHIETVNTRASPTRLTSSILIAPHQPGILGNRNSDGSPSSVILPASAKIPQDGATRWRELRSQPGPPGFQKTSDMKRSETTREL